MFKIINEETGYAVMNGIDKKSRILVPNGIEGKLRAYTVIDAMTLGKSKNDSHTFVLLEHEQLGEDDMIIARLPQNGKLFMVIREDHTEWGESGSDVAYFINASKIQVKECYNGFDDLEDEGWILDNAQYWTEDEINDK